MASTAIVSTTDFMPPNPSHTVFAVEIDSSLDRALCNNGNVYDVNDDAVKVKATQMMKMSPTLLGRLRDQRLFKVRHDRVFTVPELDNSILMHPDLLSALELVENGNNSELFLRAVPDDESKDTVGLKHDRVHLWPLAVSSLIVIKRNLVAGTVYNVGDNGLTKCLKSYFAASTMPLDQVKGSAQLTACEDNPVWRLDDVSDNSAHFTVSIKYAKLKDKSVGLTRAEKTKRDLKEAVTEKEELREKIQKTETHIGEIIARSHSTVVELLGDYDPATVNCVSIKRDDGTPALLIRAMPKA